MSQSFFSLWFISQNSLWKLSTFCGYKGIYSRVCEECEKLFFLQNKGPSDSLATVTSCKFHLWNNWLAKLSFLFCSASVVMTLQLPTCFTCVALWWVISRESLVSFSHERTLNRTYTWVLHTLLHTFLKWFPPKYRVSNCWITSKIGTE